LLRRGFGTRAALIGYFSQNGFLLSNLLDFGFKIKVTTQVLFDTVSN
jgi:hypothetical protein